MSDNKQAIEWLRAHARRCQNRAIVQQWNNPNRADVRCTESELANYFADQIEALDKPWAPLTSAPPPKLTGVKIVPPTRLERNTAARMRTAAKVP